MSPPFFFIMTLMPVKGSGHVACRMCPPDYTSIMGLRGEAQTGGEVTSCPPPCGTVTPRARNGEDSLEREGGCVRQVSPLLLPLLETSLNSSPYSREEFLHFLEERAADDVWSQVKAAIVTNKYFGGHATGLFLLKVHLLISAGGRFL